MASIIPHKIFELFTDGRRLYTRSPAPSRAFFDEHTITDGSCHYREFDPRRSKIAAGIAKGATNIGLRRSDIVLYLGVSHGYTASFISDMIGPDGLIFGVDPAPRVVRDLIFLSRDRPNIIPLLCDANHPETYQHRICEPDILIQDVSQRNQAEIFLKNAKLFLKKGGYGLLAVKARSIDSRLPSRQIFDQIRRQLEEHFLVIDFRILEPYEKDHCLIIIKNTSPSNFQPLLPLPIKNRPLLKLSSRQPTKISTSLPSKPSTRLISQPSRHHSLPPSKPASALLHLPITHAQHHKLSKQSSVTPTRPPKTNTPSPQSATTSTSRPPNRIAPGGLGHKTRSRTWVSRFDSPRKKRNRSSTHQPSASSPIRTPSRSRQPARRK